MKRGILVSISLLTICGQAYSEVSCKSGLVEVTTVDAATFAAPHGERCLNSGYSLINVPDDFAFIYVGVLAGTVETLCDDGHLEAGACSPYGAGTCKSGFDAVVDSATFTATFEGECRNSGYALVEIPDDYDFIYNGRLAGAEVTLCSNGYLSDETCIGYQSGDCISGYYDLEIDEGTITELSQDKCASSYSTFSGTTRCDRNPGETCVDLPTPIVSLSWDDDNGTTSSSTCFYQEGISLPTIPTKTGYTFAGWQVE